jgi:hypothetical protein
MPLDDAEKAQILSRIERLQMLIADLEHPSTSALDRAKIRDRMKQELEAARQAVQRFSTIAPD